MHDNKYYKLKGVYLLPNLLTTMGLFAGFYAVIAAVKNQYEIAAIAIFVAMIMDSLDGRVARLTQTESKFGAQYDSLSDVICFGMGPAILAYQWRLHSLGKIGWLIVFLYAATTALRLARFNVQHGTQDFRFFIGLPCPAAAGVISSFIWICTDLRISNNLLTLLGAILVTILAYLQVSPIKFYTFKDLDFKSKVPYFSTVLILLIMTLIALDPSKVLFSIFILYAVSGPIMWLKNYARKK